MSLIREVLRLRLSQLLINEKYKAGAFKIPIHLAMGHEAIAVAVDAVMQQSDRLVCSHRNVHYNLARAKALRPILDEYLLKEDGLAQAELGSMNLANEEKQLIYTSSILGNNLPVATGIALGQKVKESDGATFVVTGDGAMEEGTFYESLLFAKSNGLPLIIIVENNDWSMHTKIDERRSRIDLAQFAAAFGAEHERFSGNDVFLYRERLAAIRKRAVGDMTPIVVEMELTTLGGWHVEEGEHKRFIHPHAGPLSKTAVTEVSEWPELEHSAEDPVFVLSEHAPAESLKALSRELLSTLQAESHDL